MRTLLLVAGIVVAVTGRADAASFATGTEAFEAGPLPSPYDRSPELAGYRAGYLCEVTGLFWSYVSIRECVPAAIRGDEHRSDPALGKAIALAYPDVAIPVWARYGWIAILGGVLALAIGGVVWRVRRADRRRKTTIMNAIPYVNNEPAFVVGTVPSADFVEPSTRPYPPMKPRAAPPPADIEGTTKPYPPMRVAPRQAAVMPIADDGPTAADPTAQLKAEEHHRRLARGSYTPQQYDEEATHRAPSPVPAAIRANVLQPPRGLVVRSRK
jgi:hypothetical protein